MSNVFNKKNQTFFKKSLSLKNAVIGADYVITKVRLPNDKLLRPTELGLTVGSIVKVVRAAPFGSPMQLSVNVISVCIRSDRAACIDVAPLADAPILLPPVPVKRSVRCERTTSKTIIALFGNPNSGKTTLFNRLTGLHAQVGNRPGVTVESRRYSTNDLTIIDTPGIYSLQPNSPDEQAAMRCIDEPPSVIVDVVDCTALRRSLYLTMSLARTELPMVVALNLHDEAKKRGIIIDKDKLSRFFDCPFVFISAKSGDGVPELLELCKNICTTPTPQTRSTTTPNNTRSNSKCKHCTCAECAVKQITADYAAIDALLATAVSGTRNPETTQKIDKFVLSKRLAVPTFLLTLLAVFGVAALAPIIAAPITNATSSLLCALTGALLPPDSFWLRLANEGIIQGVVAVLGFAPQIMLLYGCIAALELCGYMARIAFVTDRLLSKIGLSGRSFVSIVLGFGCSVPAIASARTIRQSNERKQTIALTPFAPCSAKLTIIAFFTAQFFDGNPLIAVSFYLLSVATIITAGLAIRLLRASDEEELFLMELPPYRIPSIKDVLFAMWQRGKAFITKTGTGVLAATVVLWLLKSLDFSLRPIAEPSNSILATIGKLLSPAFAPIGFNDGGYGWQLTVATLSGISAKETVVATLRLLMDAPSRISRLGAYAFVAYNLLTVPCAAAISASFAEQGFKDGLKSLLIQLITAYCVAFVIYRGGRFAAQSPVTFAVCAAATLSVAAAVAGTILKRQNAKRPAPCKACD